MSRVVALNAYGVTPEVVLESLAERIGELREIYIVGVNGSGEHIVWASGDLKSLAYAALAFQDLALKYLNNQVVDE